MNSTDSVSYVELSLHGHKVGYVAGYRSGRNVLHFAPEFRENRGRPTFSLITHPDFPNAEKLLSTPWIRRQRLHPVLSNLLPEGDLREMLAARLKVHIDNEFLLLCNLGSDLPGALVAAPMRIDDVPPHILFHKDVTAQKENVSAIEANYFSLAGVQLKFSMLRQNGRYRMTGSGELGDWIVKPPSPRYRGVPLNEYTAMRLAEIAGVEIPAVRLIETVKLAGIPNTDQNFEKYAFAIRRFDRLEQKRIHTEDFAQVMAKYPNEKYDGASYEQIGRILYTFTGTPLANVQQFARRLLVNILLANGDAHLKNWSLIYPDTVTPELSPAYDIVMTSAYIFGEQKYALNLGRNKDWYKASMDHFQLWAVKADIPWRAVRPHLLDTLDRARTIWRKELARLPMHDEHKQTLQEHWRNLHSDFRL